MDDKWIKMADLYTKVHDPMVHQFFDLDSEELLDEKIQVLTALLEGKAPVDIPDYYKVLEMYPNDENHWDL